MKIALVHDDFMQFGGAESLFATIASLWPKAPIYTSIVNRRKLSPSIGRERIITSFMQKIPLAGRLYKSLLPLYPLAFESFNFGEFDVVFSSTTRFSKSIVTKPNTVHVCYINSVPRFLWDEEVKKEYLPKFLLILFSPYLSWLKRWDKAASQRVDFYIANSKNVAARIQKYYGRESAVVYPFADLNFYRTAKIHNWELKSQDYYLVVSRLVKWKKIDLAVKAANELGVNLKIVGVGPDASRLKRLAKSQQPTAVSRQQSAISQIEFLGRVTKEALRELYQNCRALIVTQEEDFGIASVEAQACGVPLVAYDAGGQQETVTSETGVLFKNQSAQDLKDAILASRDVKWSQSACRKNSRRFSQAVFVKELTRIARKYQYNP
ncbi:glycosyltransferase [Candidatus Curtissbacteria bacterium]|nr:glycosyltransferase [Candidatus Curtissbacteria bacterium]